MAMQSNPVGGADSVPGVISHPPRSRQRTSIFHKTTMCIFQASGKCKKGGHCKFAHSPEELRAVPDLSQTRVCAAFMSGCCLDIDCSFAHGKEEVKTLVLSAERLMTEPCPLQASSCQIMTGVDSGDGCSSAAAPSECSQSTRDDNSGRMVPDLAPTESKQVQACRWELKKLIPALCIWNGSSSPLQFSTTRAVSAACSLSILPRCDMCRHQVLSKGVIVLQGSIMS